MKRLRYYLCDVTLVPTGPEEFDAVHPFTEMDVEPAVTWSIDPVAKPVCLVVFDVDDRVHHSTYVNIPGVDALPDVPSHQQRVSTLAPGVLSQFNKRVAARGLVVTWTGSQSYGEMIQSIGEQLMPGFQVDHFFVPSEG